MQPTRRLFLHVSLAVCTLLPLYSVAAENNSWSFGIIADTQWKDMEAPFYGTSIHVIDAINAEMIRHKVDLVIQVGDLVDKPSAAGFQMRAAHNKALGKAGIRFYPVRGNHDSKGEAEVAQFKLAFPGLPGTPEGGGSSPDLPGAAGLTYSFTHKGGKFICLDTFPIIAREGKNGKAYTVSDYLPWIEAELKKNDHRFAFVFAHKNLLGQSHKDNLFSSDKENQDSNPEMQNSFFACLQRYGVKYFFSGHDHIYNRSKIKSPDGKSEITQLICGSAAHKFYSPKEPFLERETPIFQEVKHVGFIIARVKDNQVNFEYYSTKPFGEEPKKPKWKLTDSFSFTTN